MELIYTTNPIPFPAMCIILGNSHYLRKFFWMWIPSECSYTARPSVTNGNSHCYNNDSAAYDGNVHLYKRHSTRTSVGFMGNSNDYQLLCTILCVTLCMNLLPKCKVLATYYALWSFLHQQHEYIEIRETGYKLNTFVMVVCVHGSTRIAFHSSYNWVMCMYTHVCAYSDIN